MDAPFLLAASSALVVTALNPPTAWSRDACADLLRHGFCDTYRYYGAISVIEHSSIHVT